MSDTPIFDDMVARQQFEQWPGPYYDGDHSPPDDRTMILEDYLGNRVYWNGKRWCEDGYQNSEPAEGRAQCFDAWPPYGDDEPKWREVQA